MNHENSAETTRRDVTQLLQGWSRGDAKATENLTELVYAQIRAMAGKHVRANGAGGPMQATELAHEMFIRLLEANVDWRDRRHFFGVVSAALRNILIDSARAAGSAKRGGGLLHVTLSGAGHVVSDSGEASALHDALLELRELDPRRRTDTNRPAASIVLR